MSVLIWVQTVDTDYLYLFLKEFFDNVDFENFQQMTFIFFIRKSKGSGACWFIIYLFLHILPYKEDNDLLKVHAQIKCKLWSRSVGAVL